MTEQASRETTAKDIEGVYVVCQSPAEGGRDDDFGCGYEGSLVPSDWDTRDWAYTICPQCFGSNWTRVYS